MIVLFFGMKLRDGQIYIKILFLFIFNRNFARKKLGFRQLTVPLPPGAARQLVTFSCAAKEKVTKEKAAQVRRTLQV